MKYHVENNGRYDFAGQSYGGNCFPNLHKYPATMIPQVGIEVLNDLGISSGKMLDPYCGSGSSFASGLACGLRDFTGYDINPLAVEISTAKLVCIDKDALASAARRLRRAAYERAANGDCGVATGAFTNFNYWFGAKVAAQLQMLKQLVDRMKNAGIRRLALLALSLAMRDCSYVRNNEFKLYRMKPDSMLLFNPDVLGVFFSHLDKIVRLYETHYLRRLNNVTATMKNGAYAARPDDAFDVVLTSPPYGDSKTTVAYGQFSLFSNSWALDVPDARALDNHLMGGGGAKATIRLGSLIDEQIARIEIEHGKRSKEIAVFYRDLAHSIAAVAPAVAPGGYAVYVVGNRTVKGVNLRTDQFIAEQFEKHGLAHQITFERVIGNKRMPKLNSPSNQPGKKAATINNEFIVICRNGPRATLKPAVAAPPALAAPLLQGLQNAVIIGNGAPPQ